ncbi:MAG: bacterioferritin [Thermoleophilaceae bacterium]|jgi:ferritin|nr:bacterioferritin [Thermoleophilaceae bacterium]
MPAQPFIKALHEQIANEFGAEQQYIACAAYYESQTLPRLANLFYQQALEERNHAMMMIAFLLDRGGEIKVPGVAEPVNKFKDFIEPIALALEQEQKVSQQIEDLARVARDKRDYASEQFTHWFIKEQVEEVAKMSGLLQVAERERKNPMMLEYFIAREQVDGEGADPTAPRVAGGGV